MLRRPVRLGAGPPFGLPFRFPNKGERSAVRRREVDGAFRRSTTVCRPGAFVRNHAQEPGYDSGPWHRSLLRFRHVSRNAPYPSGDKQYYN